MKAIDLYSGVGGWSLGLKMAGIDVVASYEWWGPANFTNQKNNGHSTYEVDIRQLPLSALPGNVDIVVGSPPCTQFSFANRGGQGDLEDGFKDIYKFFEVIDFLKPTFWAMENVPRVAAILQEEFAPSGKLARFAHLRPEMRVINMEEFGIPQRRARCIAGNFDFERLLSYRLHCHERTLGDVLESLSTNPPRDPIYGARQLPLGVVDHVLEAPLDGEEERMNRDAKTHHPIYNNMPFPDPLHRPARTITALCTRISRESVVVPDDRQPGSYRRLSIRERASLQSFPIDFQFYGSSHAQKLKLIGNAVPPLMTFYIAQAMRGLDGEQLDTPGQAIQVFAGPTDRPPTTLPDTQGKKYPTDRRFRAAIPGLRFKSGMRFELANVFTPKGVQWRVCFYFGDSKNIHALEATPQLANFVFHSKALSSAKAPIGDQLELIDRWIEDIHPEALQCVWSGQATGLGPFDVVDGLADAVNWIVAELNRLGVLEHSLYDVLLRHFPDGNIVGLNKLRANATAVLAGILVAGTANGAFTQPQVRKAA